MPQEEFIQMGVLVGSHCVEAYDPSDFDIVSYLDRRHKGRDLITFYERAGSSSVISFYTIIASGTKTQPQKQSSNE